MDESILTMIIFPRFSNLIFHFAILKWITKLLLYSLAIFLFTIFFLLNHHLWFCPSLPLFHELITSTIVAKLNGHSTRMWLLLVKKLLDTKRLVWKPYLGHNYFHMSNLKALLLIIIKHGVHLIRATMVANNMINVKLLPQVHKIYSILLVFKFVFDIFLHFDYPYFGLKNVV